MHHVYQLGNIIISLSQENTIRSINTNKSLKIQKKEIQQNSE